MVDKKREFVENESKVCIFYIKMSIYKYVI